MKVNLNLIADFGVLPMRIVDDNNEISEVIVADTISGGKRYQKGMPERISLTRTFKDGREIRQIYEQQKPELNFTFDDKNPFSMFEAEKDFAEATAEIKELIENFVKNLYDLEGKFSHVGANDTHSREQIYCFLIKTLGIKKQREIKILE